MFFRIIWECFQRCYGYGCNCFLSVGWLSGHEYAEDNLLFAAEVEPHNTVRENKYQWVLLQRGQKLCTVRMTLCSAFFVHNVRLGSSCPEPAYSVGGQCLVCHFLFICFLFCVCHGFPEPVLNKVHEISTKSSQQQQSCFYVWANGLRHWW